MCFKCCQPTILEVGLLLTVLQNYTAVLAGVWGSGLSCSRVVLFENCDILPNAHRLPCAPNKIKVGLVGFTSQFLKKYDEYDFVTYQIDNPNKSQTSIGDPGCYTGFVRKQIPPNSALHFTTEGFTFGYRIVDLYLFSIHCIQFRKALRGGSDLDPNSRNPKFMKSPVIRRSILSDDQYRYGLSLVSEQTAVRGKAFPLYGIQGLPLITKQTRFSTITQLNNFSGTSTTPNLGQRSESKCESEDRLRQVRAILAAAALGDVEELERLIAAAAESSGCTVAEITDSCDPLWFGDTPLHYAALQGQVCVLRLSRLRQAPPAHRERPARRWRSSTPWSRGWAPPSTAATPWARRLSITPPLPARRRPAAASSSWGRTAGCAATAAAPPPTTPSSRASTTPRPRAPAGRRPPRRPSRPRWPRRAGRATWRPPAPPRRARRAAAAAVALAAAGGGPGSGRRPRGATGRRGGEADAGGGRSARPAAGVDQPDAPEGRCAGPSRSAAWSSGTRRHAAPGRSGQGAAGPWAMEAGSPPAAGPGGMAGQGVVTRRQATCTGRKWRCRRRVPAARMPAAQQRTEGGGGGGGAGGRRLRHGPS